MATEEQATAIETHAYQSKVTGFFGLIIKNQKVLSGIAITLLIALFIAIVGFTVKTATLPAEQKQINDIKIEITRVAEYQANDVVDKAIQRLKLNTLERSLNEFKEDTKYDLKEIKDMIRNNTGIVREINKNTK